ncbi:RxLR effector protein [Phytophthora megakarya]|uniref:RxLR effector protein n=1 Tax=Phytophthora megakarya TaxID=4795 RepID=A0A225UWA8_9STRA|nr:RxLR effector protein [Phytophthora megakarya]
MLEKAGDNLLESPQFATWISYADKFNVKIPRKSQSKISVLTEYYRDEGLSKMLLTAERSPQKSSIVRKLQAEQFYHWLTTKTTPSDVFVFLMLNKAGDKLLDNPQFSAWITYLDDFNKKNPENKMSIVSVLKDYCNNEKLEKMLEVVKPLPTSEKIVKRLGTEQKWMNKETPDEFFKGLKLDQVGVNVFSSPQLKKWINYMKAYNKDNPKYQTTLIATLAKYYGNRKLVQMINAAKNVESTAPFAKRLESEQFQVWLKNQWTPGDIFKLMNLDDLDDKLFSSPAFVTWTKYLSVFNMENPTKKTTLLATLTPNYYSEKRVVQLLTRATTIPSTESIAAKLHAELYQHWLAMMKPPASVFTMLNLHTEGNKLFTTPQFRTWLQYNDDFAIKAVSKEDIATDSLKTTLTGFYETSALTRMVETAMKDPSTKTIATRVKGELLNNTT